MNLTELLLHIAQVKTELAEKKDHLDAWLLLDRSLGMMTRYQIECLEPRLLELERQARRLVKEREAHSIPL